MPERKPTEALYNERATAMIEAGTLTTDAEARHILKLAGARIRELEAHIEADHKREHKLRLFGARQVLARAESDNATLRAGNERLRQAIEKYICCEALAYSKCLSKECIHSSFCAALEVHP